MINEKVETNKIFFRRIILLMVFTVILTGLIPSVFDFEKYYGISRFINPGYTSVILEGKSLVSSAELTAKAFSQGVFGEYGGKLVAIALLLFAFSTAITWCYYGDRSTAYIFGERGVFWYRNFYVLCFILAAVIDTTIVWNIAYVVVALVSIPNLIALFVLRNEMKDLTNDFVKEN